MRGGLIGEIKPAALEIGTAVELHDLFYATPARLKFLRSDKAESKAVQDIIKRLAIAEPSVNFILRDMSKGGDGRTIFNFRQQGGDREKSIQGRLAEVLGPNFTENSIFINTERDGDRDRIVTARAVVTVAGPTLLAALTVAVV